MTLDATDNDPVVLISTVMGGFSQAGLHGDWGDAQLTSDDPTYSRRVLPHYRILLESQPAPVTLVLDDAHEVSQPTAVSLLRTTMESLPADSRVIVMGRSLGTLPLAQWLGEDRVTLLTDIVTFGRGRASGRHRRLAHRRLPRSTGGRPIPSG